MSTALVAPDTAVEEVSAEVAEVVQRAQAMEVRTPDEARAATAFLVELKAAKTRGENARTKLVKPLNDHVSMINETFKARVAPLAEADKLVRDRLTAYTVEEERKAAEEQRRIDAERRERERIAEDERRAAAVEAARVEREAREAEEKRQAELREAANERAREIAMLDDYELEQLYQAGTDRELVDAEQRSRREAREAKERADIARREAEESTQRSIAAASAPAAVVETTKLASGGGSANVRRERKATAINRDLLPPEYLIVDEARINREVKAGADIPGVTVELVAGLAVRAGR